MHTTQPITGHKVPGLLDRIYFRSTALVERYGADAARFIASHIDIGSHTTEVMATSNVFNIEIINGTSVRTIVNLKQMNDIENFNKFITAVNRKLPLDGLYIGCVETIDERMRRILRKSPRMISYPYYMLDFILKRIFPKWGPTRKIYSLLTRGHNRALSVTETLGRLSVLGFKIEEYTEVGNLTFFVVRKIVSIISNSESSYGIIIRLRRIGKDRKLFNVFKIRTMHPYAEYLQGYVNSRNQLARGGKFTNDFRITSWGRWLRKFWLDETPMWYNWLRRDLKLIGVRPLSEQYFALYPEEFQKRRINYTPGLIPPFYVDLPETLDEIVESERKYFDAYDAHPWLTDFRYFWKSVYNIVMKGARSK